MIFFFHKGKPIIYQDIIDFKGIIRFIKIVKKPLNQIDKSEGLESIIKD